MKAIKILSIDTAIIAGLIIILCITGWHMMQENKDNSLDFLCPAAEGESTPESKAAFTSMANCRNKQTMFEETTLNCITCPEGTRPFCYNGAVDCR